MEIVVDFSELLRVADQGGLELFLYFFTRGAWLVYIWVIVWGGYQVWILSKQTKWFSTNKFILLAIDAPKDTEQTPKAVEQLFSTVSGAHEPLSKKEMYYLGKFQLAFAFEIVSIDGYVQFLIRTPSHWRDLIESSIYSQYPDAEITEVEDYTKDVPDSFPNDNINIWGTEVILSAKDVYPIRTYTQFEDAVSGEFKDPLSSLIETMSKIQIGEQVWLQFIVKPTGFDWIKKSLKEAYKIAGKKAPESKGILSRMFGPIFGIFFLSTGEPMIWPNDNTASSSSKKDDMPSLMLHLTPGEKSGIEAIENKASKTGFECKIRLIYISPPEQYQPSRVVASVFGSIKQFNTLDLNAFKPDKRTKTKAEYFFPKRRVNYRRSKIMRAYKARSTVMGHSSFILNTEELATVWHFPSKFIKVPLLQRTEAKKSEAPSSLPIGIVSDMAKDELSSDLRNQLKNTEFSVNLQDKHFEERFAKKDSSTVEAPQHKGTPPPNLPTV
ncbi:hypothetical protein KKH39_03755 [Patescibacteria group bacterium]|nr:hypothetical protein [Patescibacteria group bacterium]